MQDGRYFNKTLEELDQTSLVRDRGAGPSSGRQSTSLDGQEEEEDGEEEEYRDEYEDERAELASPEAGSSSPGHRVRPSPPPASSAKSSTQAKLEDEWGLYRDKSPTASQTTKGEEGEESDTEDEAEEREREYRVSTKSRRRGGKEKADTIAVT